MAERVVASDLYFPEGLRWHEGELWFTDQFGGGVIRVGDAGAETIAEVPGRPGGLGWTHDGVLLVVSMQRKSIYSLGSNGDLELYADLSGVLPAMANDMFVDPSGRAYVGNYGFDVDNDAPQVATRLVRVDPDGSHHVEAPELMFPNGTILVDDGETLIVAETFGDQLTAMHVDDDGRLSDPQVMAVLPEGCGPDGIAADSSGRIWVACAFSSRAVAVTRDGRIDQEIEVPGEGVYCPEIGGESGSTLFLGIASLDEALAERTPTGRIVAIDL